MILPANVKVVGKCPLCGGLKVIGQPDGNPANIPIAECRSCGHVAPKDLRAALKLKAQMQAFKEIRP